MIYFEWVMEQLKVVKLEDGSPGICCPRCGVDVVPVKNIMFAGHDCPDCGGTIDSATLRLYQRALARWEDSGGE